MNGNAMGGILRHLFERHRRRFPKDERVSIEAVDRIGRGDDLVIQAHRVKGYGLDCFYRCAESTVSMAPLLRSGSRDEMVSALDEAIDELVRKLLRPDRPAFRIRRDARRLSHRRERVTKRKHP